MARVFVERRELPDDLRRLFEALSNAVGGPAETAAECTPPLDILETDAAVDVLMDLPGVARASIEIVFAANVLVVAGHKLPKAYDHGDAAFHLAERAFGRFARAVTLEGAFDAGRATADLSHGELRIVLPRIDERRGREIRIPIGPARA
jgi:HSP20 family protein